MIAVPDVDGLAVSGRRDRHHAVIWSFRLQDDLVRQLPLRAPPVPLMPAGDGEITHCWGVRNLDVELTTPGRGEIVKGLLRNAEPIEERFDKALQLEDAPIGKRRAVMRRADGCQRQDARRHVEPADQVSAIESAHAVGNQMNRLSRRFSIQASLELTAAVAD